MAEIKIPEKTVSLEKLGLINQGLFEVDGELAQRYLAVIKHVFDLDCPITSFQIDKRGLSPELSDYFSKEYPDRFEYGENYLNMRSANRFMVIVSPDQKNAPLVAPQTSYDNDLCDLVHQLARHTIEDVTQKSVLFGEFENGISLYQTADDILRLRTVEISLDTLDHTVKKILELRKLSEGLDEGENALDDDYIARMKSLVKQVGDVRYRMVSDIFPIKREVHCFYAEFFKGVHVLRNFRSGDDVRCIFIYHHQKMGKSLGDEIIAVDLHDASLIDTLHNYKFLKYNEKLIPQRIKEIEDESLLADGIDVVELNDYQRKRAVIEHTPNFPESWNELRDMAKMLENTRAKVEDLVEEKSYETRLKLSEAKRKPEIMDHMLAELDPTDPIRLYEANRKKLVTEFPELPINRKRYIAYRLVEYTQGGKNV